MSIFTCIYNILTYWIRCIKSFIASFILRHILGWRTGSDDNSYNLRSGKHVIVYVHTSIYESFIGYLVSVAFYIPVISIANRELIDRDIPLLDRFMKNLNSMFINRQKNTVTVKYIADELNSHTDFVFYISPEATKLLVSDLKSDFFTIAEKTHANLHIARFNFESHIFSVKEIMNNVIIQTTKYDKIKGMVEMEMSKEIPYYPEKCHLVTNCMIKKTSLIRIDRSMLIYLPPFIVTSIMINILRGYVGF